MYMEGVLWKWTNYFNGWQARWFVLDNGILAYYKTQDEVSMGCKGSVKMSACDIAVHPTDHSRLDLIIPGEQHFYVRASSPHERQKWLVALGSAKASMGGIIEEGNMSPDVLRTKRSELRLYCDLLMQQLHSLKSEVELNDIPDIEKLNKATSLIAPTCDTFIETLDECMFLAHAQLQIDPPQPHITDASAPLSPLKLPAKKGKTVRRINSAERIIPAQVSRSSVSSAESANTPYRNRTKSETSVSILSELSHIELRDRSPSNLSNHSNTSSNLDDSRKKGRVQFIETNANLSLNSNQIGSPSQQNNASSNYNSNGTSPGNKEQTGPQFIYSGSSLNCNAARTSPGSLNIEQTGCSSSNGSQTSVGVQGEVMSDGDVFLDPIEPRLPTFFSEMKPSFVDMKLNTDGGIPVEPFLGACKTMVPIFDKLSATAFAPVKMDFQGNIRKVKTKYSTNRGDFPTIQSIIVSELAARQHTLPSSATMSILWMKRSLEFVSNFLQELRSDQDSLAVCASNAYSISLKPFHGWVVRGVFAVAVKALPYRRDFMQLLCLDNSVDPANDAYQQVLTQDVESYLDAMNATLKILNEFITANDLDFQDQI